jgi:3-oxoadipate:acetyl-CoA acetyltransferase
MKDLIVNFTPTGMVPTTAHTPFVPVEPAQIIEEALEAVGLGASMVHLHARNADQTPSSDQADFAVLIDGIRRHDKSVILCVTTSGRSDPTFESRSDVLDLEGDSKPDMASLTLSSLNFAQSASVNSPDCIQQLAAKMLEKKIKPELEVFDAGMVNYAKYLIRKKLLKGPFYFNLLFGNIAGMQADFSTMGNIVNSLPDDSTWAFAGIGSAQLRATSAAVAMGGNVRIGLEDNLFFDQEKKNLATNMDLIKRVVALAELNGRKIAKADAVRRVLDLNPAGKRISERDLRRSNFPLDLPSWRL